MAQLIDIAAAVVSALNAGSFSVEFTATRSYLPRLKLTQMGSQHVTVAPAGVTVEMQARGVKRGDMQVDVAVQTKPATLTDAALDAQMDLTQEVVDAFLGLELSGRPGCWCIAAENAPAYSTEHLEQFGQFTSVVRLTFREGR